MTIRHKTYLLWTLLFFVSGVVVTWNRRQLVEVVYLYALEHLESPEQLWAARKLAALKSTSATSTIAKLIMRKRKDPARMYDYADLLTLFSDQGIAELNKLLVCKDAHVRRIAVLVIGKGRQYSSSEMESIAKVLEDNEEADFVRRAAVIMLAERGRSKAKEYAARVEALFYRTQDLETKREVLRTLIYWDIELPGDLSAEAKLMRIKH